MFTIILVFCISLGSVSAVSNENISESVNSNYEVLCHDENNINIKNNLGYDSVSVDSDSDIYSNVLVSNSSSDVDSDDSSFDDSSSYNKCVDDSSEDSDANDSTLEDLAYENRVSEGNLEELVSINISDNDFNDVDVNSSNIVDEYNESIDDSVNVSGSVNGSSLNSSNLNDNVSIEVNEDYESYDNGDISLVSQTISSLTALNTKGSSLTATSTFTLAEILKAAEILNKYILEHHGLPSNITVGGTSCTIPQFLYIMTSAICNINQGKNSATYNIKVVNSPDKDLNGDWITSSSITKTNYVDLAERVLKWINNEGRAPNYASLSDGKKADYKLYTYAFASILTYYKINNVLPSTYVFSSSVFESYFITKELLNKIGENLTFYLTSDNIINTATDNNALNTIKNTLTALGYNVKIVGVGPNMHNKAWESGCIGSNSVLLCCFGGVDVGCIEEWTGDLGNYFLDNYKGAFILPIFYLDPYGCASNLHDYIGIAWDADYGFPLNNSASYMENHGISYIQTGTVNAVCSILNTLFKNSKPITNTSNSSSSTVSVTVSQVVSAAISLKSYVLSNKVLPSTVTVGGVKYSCAQFSYLMSVAVQYLKSGKSSSTKISVGDVSNRSASFSVSNTLSLADCIVIAKCVSDSGSTSKVLYSYVSLRSVKYDYRVYTYAFAKILAFYKSNGRLPNTCLFESGVFKSNTNANGSISGITYKKGINEVCTETSLAEYLKASGRCALNTNIKNLASSLTKGCSSTLEKATVIFNYVRDTLSYSFYYNSVYNASGALSKKTGNCCDHSNLLVALYRASGIEARYCHAKCTFNSGLNTGHVWTQVLVDGVWYAADATSSQNTLGHINNWKSSSMTNLKQYSLLPF